MLMFCQSCGAKMQEDAGFCTACGKPAAARKPLPSPPMAPPNKTKRGPKNAFAGKPARNDFADIDARYLTEAQKNNLLTSLHMVAANGDLATARELIRRGANLNARNINGATPLILAASNNNPEMVLLLLGAGADASLANNKGDTPLDFAQKLGLFQIEALLK